MRKKAFAGVIAVFGLFAVATGIKAWLNSLEFRTLAEQYPYGSSYEAKQNGAWLCKVTLEPSTIAWMTERVDFQEAWIQKSRAGYTLAWFPTYDYFLCFTAHGTKGFGDRGHPVKYYFVLESEDNYVYYGARNSGPWCFNTRLFKPLNEKRRLFLYSIEDRKRVEGVEFVATPDL